MGHLHVGSAGGDKQRGAYVPQLMGCVADNPIGVGSGIPLGELEVPAPHGIAEKAAPLTINESAVQPAVAALAARHVAVDQAADRAGDPYIPGTWAQVRIGAAIAHLLKDGLDGTAEQVTPVLTMSPEFRIATVTGWLADLDKHLANRRYFASPAASGMRQQIREFTADALLEHDAGETV